MVVHSFIRMLLASAIALGTVAGTAGRAEAAFTFTVQEQGTAITNPRRSDPVPQA